MITDKIHNGILAGIVAVVLFIGAAIIEVLITIWAFKKFGGCPLMDEHSSVKSI